MPQSEHSQARILVAAPSSLLADGLAALFTLDGHTSQAVELDPERRVLHQFRRFDPALAVVAFDVSDPSQSPAFLIRLVQTGTPVLALTPSGDHRSATIALDCGAAGYVDAGTTTTHLHAAVARVLEGRPVNSTKDVAALRARKEAEDRQRSARLEPFMSLSPREAQVLADLMRGTTADRIAADRGITLHTVRSHIRSVLKKLDVSGQLQAVALAREADWRVPDRAVPAYERWIDRAG